MYIERLSDEQMQAARDKAKELVIAGGESGVSVSRVRSKLQGIGLWPENRQQRGQIMFTARVKKVGDPDDIEKQKYVHMSFVTKKRRERKKKREARPKPVNTSEMCFELADGSVTIKDDDHDLTFKRVVRVVICRGE